MSSTAAAAPASMLVRLRSGVARLRTGRCREAGLFVAAVVLIVGHVIDDSFIQPQPGTSASDHLVSGLVPAHSSSARRGGIGACAAAVAARSRSPSAYLGSPPAAKRGITPAR